MSKIKCFPSTPAREKIGRLQRLTTTYKRKCGYLVTFIVRVRRVDRIEPGATVRPRFNVTLRRTGSTNIRILSLGYRIKVSELRVVKWGRP